jgi:hypothetical protein
MRNAYKTLFGKQKEETALKTWAQIRFFLNGPLKTGWEGADWIYVALDSD